MIFALVLTAAGVFFTWAAIMGWRHRREESVSLLEAAILKVTGAEPLPISRFDRWLQRFHLVMTSIMGPSALVIGGYGLFREMGLL
ncbi:MAG: hypothetical protein ACKOPQ_04390 [Novosphingobium sp.]